MMSAMAPAKTCTHKMSLIIPESPEPISIGVFYGNLDRWQRAIETFSANKRGTISVSRERSGVSREPASERYQLREQVTEKQ